MAQTGYTPISIYYSATAAAAPTSGNLVAGELAINTADGKLFYKDSSGVVQTIASKDAFNGIFSTISVAGNSYLSTASGVTVVGGTSGNTKFTVLGQSTLGIARFTNSDYVNGVSGSGLLLNCGATSGNTYSLIDAYSAGFTNFSSLILNSGGGNVGIKTTSPSYTLDVNGDVRSASVFRLNNGTVEANFQAVSTTNALIGTISNHFFEIRTNNTQRMYFAPDKTFVGIGTATVTSPITAVLSSSVSGNGVMDLQHPGNTSFGVVAYLRTYAGTDNPSLCLSHYNGGSPANYGIACDAGGTLLFLQGTNPNSNAGSEKMRLFSTGVLLLNYSSQIATERFGVVGDNIACSLKGTNTGNVTTLRIERAATDGDAVTFFYGGTQKGYISVTSTGTSYQTLSDYRLKENIAPMTGALEKVSKLKPVTYDWKGLGKNGQGFIAHELQEIVPECVTGKKDAVKIETYEVTPAIPATYDDEGRILNPEVFAVKGEREVPDYQGIDTSFLVATLTAAIQEQQAMIKELQAKVAALEAA